MGDSLKKTQTLRETEGKLRIGLDTSIRKALRIMVDNKEFSAKIVDGDDVISEITVGELREAIRDGVSSSTTMQQFLLGNLFREIFFKQQE